MPLSAAARPPSTATIVDAAFGDAAFVGDAAFGDASFIGDAASGDATFIGDAVSGEAAFVSDAALGEAAFAGDAAFGDGDATLRNSAHRRCCLRIGDGDAGDAASPVLRTEDTLPFGDASFIGD